MCLRYYSIGDLLGQIGGFFEVLRAIGSALTLIVAQRLLFATLASSVYQVDPTEPSGMESDVIRPNSQLSNNGTTLQVNKDNVHHIKNAENPAFEKRY